MKYEGIKSLTVPHPLVIYAITLSTATPVAATVLQNKKLFHNFKRLTI